MKVAVFSSRSYDRPLLEKHNTQGHELRMLECSLSPETVSEASGCEAVALFSKDNASAIVLEQLYQIGVRYVALRSAGYNHIDLDKARQLGITVARVSAYSPHAIAEHSMALILALNRKLIQANQQVQQYNFSLDRLMGFNIGDKRVGVIGTGNIGAAMVAMLHGFGCNILTYDIEPNKELEQKYGVQYVGLEDLLCQADIISLHVPLNEQTRYMIDANAISKMKKGVMLINTSRGALLDTNAAIAALKSGQIGYLGLDVYENEKPYFFEDYSTDIMQDDVLARLMTFPNVLLTGHQAFLTETALNNIAQTTLENINAFDNKILTSNFLTNYF